MTQITNIAAYKFIALDRLPERREAMLARASSLGLKGTILLAEEGINLFLAGHAPDIDAFLSWLRDDPAFAVLEVKFSVSSSVPFGRLRVRIKREIIRMNQPAIRPAAARAPAVMALDTLAEKVRVPRAISAMLLRTAAGKFVEYPSPQL